MYLSHHHPSQFLTTFIYNLFIQVYKAVEIELFILLFRKALRFRFGFHNLRRMVSTRRSQSIERVKSVGLGPSGGVGGSSRKTSSRKTSRGSVNARLEDYSYDQSKEYTPGTPTREYLKETIENLDRENAFLRTKLTRVESEKDEVRELLSDLQAQNVKLQEDLNSEMVEGDKLFWKNHKLVWKCKEIEWERRIIAQSLKTRLGDRALYYRGVALTYLGLIRGYFSSWAHQYNHGPSLSLIWNYRPDNSYEDHVRDIHYPADMTF